MTSTHEPVPSIINTIAMDNLAVDELRLDQDFKRAADHKYKWKNGDWHDLDGGISRPINSRTQRRIRWSESSQNHDRKRTSRRDPALSSASLSQSTHRLSTTATAVMPRPTVLSVDAFSHDIDQAFQSTCSFPHDDDDGFKYSYDARGHPSDGSTVFGYILDQALEKYEETHLLRVIQDEYAFIDFTSDVDLDLTLHDWHDDASDGSDDDSDDLEIGQDQSRDGGGGGVIDVDGWEIWNEDEYDLVNREAT